MLRAIGRLPVADDENVPLPALPARRCLTKDQAAAYLGIGVTLLASLDIPGIKFGRRLVYDVLDLDAWLTEYKHRGRAGKETLWPVKQEFTGGRIAVIGGSVRHSRTASEYAKVLGLKTETKPKPS